MCAVKIKDFRHALKRNNYFHMPEELVKEYKKMFNEQEDYDDSISVISFSWNGLKDIGLKASIVNNRTKNYYEVTLPVELIRYFF